MARWRGGACDWSIAPLLALARPLTPAAPPDPPLAHSTPFYPAPAARILVMDDDESLRAVLGLSLELMGHRVGLAADSHAAFAQFHAARAAGDPFRIALLDVTVPGGRSGPDTWRELRALDPALRAIVMSGYTDGPVLRDWAALGFSAALTKPFESDALAAALARALPA